jgi:prefoldin subunit 5
MYYYMATYWKRFQWVSKKQEIANLRQQVDHWKQAYAILKAEYEMLDAIVRECQQTRGVLL